MAETGKAESMNCLKGGALDEDVPPTNQTEPSGHQLDIGGEAAVNSSACATVDPSSPAATLLPAVPNEDHPVFVPQRFPNNLPSKIKLVLGLDGKAYAIRHDAGNPYALPVGCRALSNIIRELALEEGVNLRTTDLRDIHSFLQASAEMADVTRDVWTRIAPVEGGVEIDLGDEAHYRVRITAGKVEVITTGSETPFYRPPASLPMVMPAETGNLTLLKKYLSNMNPVTQTLLTAWICYTLGLPKLPTSKYVHLQVSGGQGSGKSSLCTNILSRLIDPSRIGVRTIPRAEKDLAVATQTAHVVYFDNVRGIPQFMADLLCIASTGGVIASRKLYTDEEQHVLSLHAAIVLNGLHPFIDQPDLAHRCLTIEMRPIPENQRKSDTALAQEFEADLPAIQRGIFDLLAQIFVHLPTVQVTVPERMIDFSRFLAAMEKVHKAPAGVYQRAYSEILNQGQRDALHENVLAAAIIELAENMRGDEWTLTPKELLAALNTNAGKGTVRSKEWPQNEIALARRLRPLVAGLKSQGIGLEFGRNHERYITITYKETNHD